MLIPAMILQQMDTDKHFNEAEHALKKYWGYDQFRPGQGEAVKSVLEGRETVVLFPTGGGKSLCYQVPAMVLDGLTLVISPLVSLMQDQVEQLTKLGIRATFINSTLPGYEVEQRLVNARNGMYKMLYIAPERLTSDRWKIEQPALNIQLIAVDEAHCISQWGHDFRPSYRSIREELGDAGELARWIALTATATPEVRQDLIKSLQFSDPNVVTAGFRRPNLHWWVNDKANKKEVLQNAVSRGAKLGSGIIYSGTRRDCEKWARYFTKQGIRTKPYHAGLESKQREKIQQEWIKGDTPVVAATNAFGMGIDKPDCRFVIHYSIPFSLEAYYQEAGRAGRDGEISYPILIFKQSDVKTLKSRIVKSYPEFDTLEKVYNGLCDELSLATGSEHEKAEPVQIEQLTRRTGISSSGISSAINILQRLGVIETFELRESRIGIQFIVSQEYLREYIDDAPPRKAGFIDTLFRQSTPYAFGDYYFMDVYYLRDKLKVTENQLLKALTVFSEHDQILKMKWHGDETLIKVLTPRMKKLSIDHDKAYHYRDVLLRKLDYVTQYATTEQCREVFLRQYFGETDAKPCGTCDNCRRNSNEKLSITEKEIRTVKKILIEGERSIPEIRQQTKWGSEKLKSVMDYMLREELVAMTGDKSSFYRLSNR